MVFIWESLSSGLFKILFVIFYLISFFLEFVFVYLDGAYYYDLFVFKHTHSIQRIKNIFYSFFWRDSFLMNNDQNREKDFGLCNYSIFVPDSDSQKSFSSKKISNSANFLSFCVQLIGAFGAIIGLIFYFMEEPKTIFLGPIPIPALEATIILHLLLFLSGIISNKFLLLPYLIFNVSFFIFRFSIFWNLKMELIIIVLFLALFSKPRPNMLHFILYSFWYF